VAGSDHIVLPVRSRRQQRAALGHKLQHALPGGLLLIAGLQTLLTGPHGLELGIAVFQVVVSVLLLGSTVEAVHVNRHLLRSAPPGEHHVHFAHRAHHGIEWGDLFAAALFIAEGLERKMHGHHFPRPMILGAATRRRWDCCTAASIISPKARRSIRVTANALTVPGMGTRRRHG
jgi:hypothetical protein